MRVLVIGAGKLGTLVIQQLRKSEGVELVVADPHERPEAVVQGVVDRVDVQAHVTALNFEEVLARTNPDLGVRARTVDDWEKSDTPMGSQYVTGMERELTKARIAVLPVSCDILGPC